MSTKQAINITLQLLGVAGLDGISIAAPNALQALDILLRESSKPRIPNHERLLYELKRQGLVHISEFGGKGKVSLTLTPAGIHRLQRSIIDELEIPRQKPWDKKWRVITFDIPTRQSKQRAYFTRHLKSMGLYMLQRSIWIYPFPCFDQVEQVAGHFNVLRYCAFFEVSEIDKHSAQRLLRRFATILLV